MKHLQETYNHEQFTQDYEQYLARTGNAIKDLDYKSHEFFVTWCRRCGRYNVTRLNLRYSVFYGNGEPLCFYCQSEKNLNTIH